MPLPAGPGSAHPSLGIVFHIILLQYCTQAAPLLPSPLCCGALIAPPPRACRQCCRRVASRWSPWVANPATRVT